MQQDFHFYAIYVLCRCSGMAPENSKKVAYASQHTDDADYEHTLKFEDGGKFQQARSPHLVCRENMEMAQQMVRTAADLKDEPYLLHRLGIALHIYADIWSHRDCSGLPAEPDETEVCRKIYGELNHFLSKNQHPEYRTGPMVDWENVEKSLGDLFRKGKNPTRIGNLWKENLNRSAFGFTCCSTEKDLFYDERQWFEDAVEVHIDPQGRRTYRKKDHFETSNWKYFHDAAASHRVFAFKEMFALEG